MLVDIGVNLTNSQFDKDRPAVVERAQGHDVTTLIITGTSVSSSEHATELVVDLEGHLFSTAGVHPHDAKNYDMSASQRIREIAQKPGVVAIGECGLDFNRDFSPRDMQRSCFDDQIQIASELKRPLFMHQRDAHGAFMEMIVPRRNDFGQGVVHCFTGTADELDAYLDLDLHIGITGWICDERRGLHLRELVRRIPLNRLMIETDCPYLLPRTIRPKPRTRRNEPMYLRHVAATVAECMGLRTDDLIAATTRTAYDFFDLPSPR